MILAVSTAVGYAILFIVALRREGRLAVERWVAFHALTSLLFAALFAGEGLGWLARLPSEVSLARLTIGVYLLALGLLGSATLSYLGRSRSWIWLVASLLIAAGVLIFDFASGAPRLGGASWREAAMTSPASPAALAALAFWALGGLFLLGLSVYGLNEARLPLHANRILFWLIALPLILAGEGLAAWGGPLAVASGQIVRLVGVAGLVYAATNERIVDVRGFVRSSVGNAVLVLVTMAIILLAVGLSQFLSGYLSGSLLGGAVALVGLMLALAYHILRGGAEQLINQTVLLADYDAARVAMEYSQRVANVLDIEQLARVAGQAVRQSVNARQAGLLLLTIDTDAVDVRPIQGVGSLSSDSTRFVAQSPILTALSDTRRPLFQYDIDVNPAFRSASEEERGWWRALGMDVFVPMMDGKELSALLAVGPRASGDPYRQGELDLMTTLAEQTAVALKNARLFMDLRSLNEQMTGLNESLQSSNEKLEAIDAAKTDFITIASHELRTPLTQLRGYADVLGTMSKAGALKPESVESITASLLKACDRLDQVIGQMLDISRIDVEAMQLRFVEINVESVLRMAVDQYAAAMRERKQSLTAQGLRNLPPILGDFKRLVQAFGNVIGNAVKFTPDGGRLDINGRRLTREDAPDAIEIVVSDTGVGIDPQYHNLIFEKFFRVGSTALHSTGATKFMGAGPGLGLPITRGIVEGHGGRIWVESPGFSMDKLPGSKFHIVLPLQPPALTVSQRAKLTREISETIASAQRSG